MASRFDLLKSAIENIVGKAEQRSYGMSVPDETVTKMPSGDLLIKGMGDDDLKALNKSLEESGWQEGLNLGRIGEFFNGPQINMNLEDFDFETVLKNIKTNNKDLFQYLRRKTQSMDAMIAIATKAGREDILYKLLGRKPGEVRPPEEVLAGLLGVIKLGRELEFGARQALSMPEGEKVEAWKKLRMIGAIQSNLAAQVSGNISEYGRGLGLASNLARLENMNLKNYAENLGKFVEEMDEGLIDYHLHTFLTLQRPAARAKYAEKGWLAKTYDIAMENYINALLSSPVTHMVNMASNAGFQVLTLAERGLAGVIGNVRTLGGRRGEVGDQRYIGEAAAEAHGLAMAQKDALTLMAKTFVTGESGDLVTKIDLRNRRALGSTDNLMDIASSVNQGDYTKAAIDAFGISTRAAGRLLATEDEYFKVITRRRVQYREAFRASQIAFTTGRKSGLSEEAAREKAEQAYQKIMIEPSQEVLDLMTSESRKMTFQGSPEGFFGRVGPLLHSIPFIKTIVPFYNTPTNVINEAFDRSLNWSPLYKAIKGDISGREFDDAMAKLVLGNSVAMAMYSFIAGDYGDDVIVTGSGPSDFSTKYNIQGSANIQPYSIGFKQDDGTYRQYTISRFDPISALLIMGADMRDYARYEDDPAVLSQLTKAYVLSVANYASQMPFLQGVSDLMAAAGNSHQSKEDFFERMQKFVGKQVGNVGTNVIGNMDRAAFGLGSYASNYLTDGKYPLLAQNSLYATIERIKNPEASNTNLPAGEDILGNLYTETNPFMQGFYSALQNAKGRNPFYSDKLLPKLDYWANIQRQGEGKWHESLNPVRI
ncbi:MAG: hypothetical protein ACPGO7_03465, partial [Alphaproteobacteria bacterium]